MNYVSTDVHPSKSDAKPHFTLDCYSDDDEPVGTIHVYEDFRTYTVYAEPRAKAKAVSRLSP